jgi:hypothetical protein
MNSDISFNLMYGTNVSRVFLQHVINALQPYPRGVFKKNLAECKITSGIVVGLLTDIGMVVANPAYDSNTTNIDVLGRASYQGTVIWCVIYISLVSVLTFVDEFNRSFQQGLMAGGLARQLGFCSKNISNRTVDTNPPPKKKPEWCSDKTFVKDLTDAQSRLWTSILGAKESELFIYKIKSHDHIIISDGIDRSQHGSVELLVR